MDISRPENVIRLGIIGGECTGKSTMASALAVELSGLVAREVLREFVTEHGRVPSPKEQRAVMLQQIAREDSLACSPCTRAVIGDPAPIMTAVYSDVYYGDGTLLPDAIEHAARYGLVLWCRPDLPWIPDPGQRDGPEYRTLVDERIERLVSQSLRPAGIQVLELTDTHESRLAAVIVALGSVGPRSEQGRPSRAWQPPASDPAK